MLFVVLFLFICPIVGIAQSRSAEDGSGEVVAVINGKRVITRREVDEVIGHQLRALQEKIYDLRKKALDNLVVRILLEEEAQARGVMIEELDDQLVPEKVIVDSGQVDKVYAENIGLLGNMSEQEARQRIRLDLEAQIKMQKYKASLNEIRRRSKIDIFLPEPAPLIFRPEEEGPSRGPAQAAVTVVEFSDFQCPYCKQTSGVLNEILQTYKDDVRLVFKHLPLQIHLEAFKAAQASFCAREQGKFWPYHD